MLSKQPKWVQLTAAPVLAAFMTTTIMGIGLLGGVASLVMQLLLLPMLILTIYCGFVPLMAGIGITGVVISAIWDDSTGLIVVLAIGISCLVTWLATWRCACNGTNDKISGIWGKSWVPYENSGLLIPVSALAMTVLTGVIGGTEMIAGHPVGSGTFHIVRSILERSQSSDLIQMMDNPEVRFGLTGFIAVILMMAVVVNALIADWMGAILLRRKRKRMSLIKEIRLPAWYPFAMIGLIILVLVPMNVPANLAISALDQTRVVATNMMIVMLFPALFMGLSVIHAWLGLIRRGRLVASLFFYAVWSVFFLPVGMMIVTLGILANPLRIGRPSSAQSSESITG